MVSYVNIGGHERPIAFGFDVGLEYEIETGGNYNELVYKILGQAEMAKNRYEQGDIEGVASSMSLLPMSTVVYYALRFGCREERIEVDFQLRDVAAWIFGDNAAMEKCMTLLFESLPRPSGVGEAPAKKKPAAAQSGSTGKALSKRLQ